MIICIGGFAGSGRNRFSQDLSKALGFYNYPVREIKNSPTFKRIHELTRPTLVSTYADDLLIQMYQKITSNFPLLSKMYPDIIVKDHFHREIPREFFFKEAEKYFGHPIFVWTEASAERSHKRLGEIFSKNENRTILTTKIILADAIRAEFQPFTRDVHMVDYMSNPTRAVGHVVELVTKSR